MRRNTKVGICACWSSRNYGSMLQAFATQVVIENLGYESEYILYQKKKTPFFLIRQLPRLINRDLLFDKMLLLRKNIRLIPEPAVRTSLKQREEAFHRFETCYYRHFSRIYHGYNDLCRGARKYDTIVVGSDQLWTPGGLASGFYNLMFVPDEVNKVSYAASFGVSRIPWYQTKRTREYLSRINYLSVREVKGAEIIRTIAGRKAKVVADPTLLLNRREWETLIPVRQLLKQPYLFCYFLGENPEHRRLAADLQDLTGLPVVTTPFLDSFVKEDRKFGTWQMFDAGPDDFVNLIRGAEYILTDSFHGSVFSILHHKKFLTFDRFSEGRNSRNSRIDSLCSLLGLENRRYQGRIETIFQDIDYTEVDRKIDEFRKYSLDYLSDALEKRT